jgi:coproporphyrinogen III oxidase
MAHFAEPLASKVGCRLRQLTDKDLEMFMLLHRVFFDSYLEILAERKHDSFSGTDVQLKLLRNGRWLEYFVLKDKAVRSALENGYPPELLIDIGFPPKAAF